MRKVLFTVFFVALLSAGFVAFVHAQASFMEDYATLQQKLEKGKSGPFAGTITKVDQHLIAVDLTSPVQGERIARLDFAKSRGGAYKDLNLRPGDKVEGQYQELNGMFFVTDIKKVG